MKRKRKIKDFKEIKTVKPQKEKRAKRQTTIKKKLLISVVSLTVVIILACASVSGFMLYRNAESSMEEQVQKIALAYDDSVSKAVQNYEMSVEAIAKNDDITNPNQTPSAQKMQLSSLASQHGFTSVDIADMNGKTLEGQDISQTEYFQTASYGSTYFSSTVKQDDGSVVMYLATKVKNTTNYEGVVIATLSSSSFNQVISNVSIGENGYGFIVDSSGKIIADKNRDNVDSFINYSDLAQKDQTYAGAASLTTKMVGRQAGKTYCDIDGTSYYAFYAPLLNTDNWAIAVLADTAEMMSGFYQSIWITVGVAVLFVILSIIIAFRIANPIVKPVVSLVKRIESLSEGDLHTEVPKVKSRDEISTLSLAFQDTINSLNTYIEDIRNVLGSISQGDYTVQIDREYKGDFVAIRESLNYIVRSLNKTFGEINQVSDQIAAGSQQMASGAQVLAQGATEQAGTVQELSASMSEISDQVNRNAENARNADLISKEATQEVEKGDGHMTRMITAMDKISETSGSIGKIIKTIQDIAFQTNILALNAAVEAARAGEAGKGFAVVADEVRNLASKSAEAAKNTSLLIQDSFSAVEDGQKVAADTAQSLKEIVKKVQGMTELFDKITRASQEQARSIAQVNQGVEQISAVVQTNSANAEQSAATSEELDRQVQLLKEEFAKLQLMDAETLAEAEEAARNLMDDGGPEDQAPEEEETPSASEEPEQPEQPVTVS